MRKTLRRKIEQFTFSISRGGGKGEQIRGKIKKRKKEKNYFQPAGEEERRRARWQGRSWTCSSRRSTTCSPRCTTGWKQSTQVREQTNKKQQRKRFVAVISWRLLRTGNYGIGIYVKQICVGVLGFSLNIEISFPTQRIWILMLLLQTITWFNEWTLFADEIWVRRPSRANYCAQSNAIKFARIDTMKKLEFKQEQEFQNRVCCWSNLWPSECLHQIQPPPSSLLFAMFPIAVVRSQLSLLSISETSDLTFESVQPIQAE